jgi:hypothetical protein
VDVRDGGIVSELANVDPSRGDIQTQEMRPASSKPVCRERHPEQAESPVTDEPVADNDMQSPTRDLTSYVAGSLVAVQRQEPANVLAYDPRVRRDEGNHSSIALCHNAHAHN